MKEDIIAMALDAGILWSTDQAATLERFAALVAAAEREACAKVCEGITSTYHENDPRKCADAIRARGQA